MELTKEYRICIIRDSSGEFATTKHNVDHCRTLLSHHAQRNTSRPFTLTRPTGNDNIVNSISNVILQAAPIWGGSFYQLFVKSITINKEECL